MRFLQELNFSNSYFLISIVKDFRYTPPKPSFLEKRKSAFRTFLLLRMKEFVILLLNLYSAEKLNPYKRES